MKKLFIFFAAILLAANMAAQEVSYTYKALAPEGCTVSYSVVLYDSISSIIVTVSSDRMVFQQDPTLKIRTFSNDVIELKGSPLTNRSSSGGIVIGNMVVPFTELNTMAQFVVTPEQWEMIKEGVEKVRISLIPMNHERTFKRDLIGKKLYKLYQKALIDRDNF